MTSGLFAFITLKITFMLKGREFFFTDSIIFIGRLNILQDMD